MERQTLTSLRSVLLPAGAGPACVVVCEETGRWAVALRRELGGRSVPLRETRSLADCCDALREAPASLAVIELNPRIAPRLLHWMLRLERDLPLARVAVVAGRGLAAWEGLLREAGAVYFTTSPRRLRALADVARRHLELVPVPQVSITERIRAGLPWPRPGSP